MHALPRVHRHLLTAESCTTEPVAELAAADGAAAEPASEAATEPDPAEAAPQEEGAVPAAEATTDGETAGGEQVGASGAVEAQDNDGELQSALGAAMQWLAESRLENGKVMHDLVTSKP